MAKEYTTEELQIMHEELKQSLTIAQEALERGLNRSVTQGNLVFAHIFASILKPFCVLSHDLLEEFTMMHLAEDGKKVYIDGLVYLDNILKSIEPEIELVRHHNKTSQHEKEVTH